MVLTARHDGGRMSVAEFLAWNAGDDLRYELVDGVPVAQSAPSSAHGVAAINIGATLRSSLRASRRPCLVETGSALRITGRSNVRVPDVLVRCGSRVAGEGTPLLAVEVLSPANSADEMAAKREDYALCGIREVLEVSQERAAVHLYSHEGGAGWRLLSIIGLESAVRLDSVDAVLALADIYEGVFPAEEAAAEG
ncbi:MULTISPECIES: Uma2 family endonuclease [unclassified Azospirillum]|uniref:Uma2 family endonuclease n=1 Tax=unclassified Azospirillum TaxID=2630922 RepID=UPI000B670756|nr:MULTISPECIES: Uma2 family endonuclease [unclassified Azospirillum]SNS27308.1 Endonuclease, Uma2 family (restriction endonuclease fold) [Azospirillum sp. RU38E]SNS45823.1 Endonuclease, Uma2 family (restriction endonuclease fold) [Azospirillum sp. RU37A]